MITNARRARALAKLWAIDIGMEIPGFIGAILHGSINTLAEKDMVPTSSDVDILVFLAGDAIPASPGKFSHHGVRLDVSYLSERVLDSTDAILGSSHLAPTFNAGAILADTNERLANLQAIVAREFRRRPWVVQRARHARQKVLDNLANCTQDKPWPDQVTACLFGAGVTTHMLLVAGLKSPTVRKRYEAVQVLLKEYGRLDIHEELLELLGSSNLRRPRIEQHLANLTKTFDATRKVVRTPYRFASDISEEARPIAINGTRVAIRGGFQREAMFWIAATYSRCIHILEIDAPDTLVLYAPGFQSVLNDLGIGSPELLQKRVDQVRNYLPQLWTIVATIIATNPEIEN